MTQMRLAALLEVDQSLVSMIAAAKRNLTMENLERLSQIAGLPTPILVWKAIGQPRNLSAVQQRVFKKVDAILRRAFPEFRKATDVSGQGKTGLPGNAVT
jgi:plasmid maintenance system antidote protein VapI